MIQGLTAQITQLRAELNTVNQQINRFPRFRGRMANNYAQGEYQDLIASRNQLNFTLNQQNMQLGQLRSHPPDPKAKQKIDDEVQAKHDEYVQAVHDLSQLVTTTKDKYAALAKNDEVSEGSRRSRSGDQTQAPARPVARIPRDHQARGTTREGGRTVSRGTQGQGGRQVKTRREFVTDRTGLNRTGLDEGRRHAHFPTGTLPPCPTPAAWGIVSPPCGCLETTRRYTGYRRKLPALTPRPADAALPGICLV